MKQGTLFLRLRLGLQLRGEGLVSSSWHADTPGPARRIYKLTPAGARLLDAWAEALRSTESVIAMFLGRYDRGKRRTT